MDSCVSLILTVPHACCPLDAHRYGHPCDSLASAAARAIAAAYGRGASLLLGDVPRTQRDLNRRESRALTSFRVRLRRLMHENPNAFVLDVHSFPGEGITFSEGATERTEVVLLDIDARPAHHSVELRDALSKAGVSVSLVRGSHENDIEEEARSLGMRSVLAVFDESLGVERLHEISRAVAAFFS